MAAIRSLWAHLFRAIEEKELYRAWRLARPVPYLFRTYETFYDALRAWAADRPPKGEAEGGRSLEPLRLRLPLKKRAAKRIGNALGETGKDYRRAKAELFDCIEEFEGRATARDWTDPSFAVARDLAQHVWPLLLAYADHRRFFSEQAPKHFAGAFDTSAPGFSLEKSVGQWGFAALCNPAVRRAFDERVKNSGPDGLHHLLSVVEERNSYEMGPPEGRTRGTRKAGRPKKADAALRPGSQERRIYRGGVRKRRKVS